MAYRNKRPNSRRGRLYSAFAGGGLEGALKVAAELGFFEATVRRWVRQWESAPSTSTKRSPHARVHLSYWPERIGYVAEEGPEQSGVQFDDGAFRYVPNNNLVKSKPDK